MKKILVAVILTLVSVISTFAQHDDHEYAPLTEKKIEYKDWTYKNVLTDKDVNLREFLKGKKLVQVFYFAPWCHSSNYQAPVTQKLYEKYKDKGFAVIGVSLYGSIEHVHHTMKKRGMGFPVVSESLSEGDRKRSLHYKYRYSTGDYRKWGTPWNIFLTASKLEKEGSTLVKKAMVVNGEIRKKETEAFIRKSLGLSAEKVKIQAKVNNR